MMSTTSDTRASARSKCEDSRLSCLGGFEFGGVIVIVGGEDWVRRGWVSLGESDDGDSFGGGSTDARSETTGLLCLNNFIATARCGEFRLQ
jgi:hypothetical protein